ncbi:Uncharacterized protein ToN1_33800 [Aromatoleum petrolei]|nr:Uncharacterized protein ToN1_33800 [Aromatoleum petrolei]
MHAGPKTARPEIQSPSNTQEVREKGPPSPTSTRARSAASASRPSAVR